MPDHLERASEHPNPSLGLLPQVLLVLVELLVVFVATGLVFFGVMVTGHMFPPLGFLILPCGPLIPVVFVFLIGCLFHRRFTTAGVVIGWAVAGSLLGLYFILSGEGAGAPTARDVVMLAICLSAVPSIGALTSICGMRYRIRPRWKYIALPGAWFLLIIYAYAQYDWLSYCGRI